MTYYDAYIAQLIHGSTASLDSVISRLDSISESGVTLESYKYLGLSMVVEEDHPQDGVIGGGLLVDEGDQIIGEIEGDDHGGPLF